MDDTAAQPAKRRKYKGKYATAATPRKRYQPSDDGVRRIENGINDHHERALWALFARVKYWAAKTHGPRDDANPPATLNGLAVEMIEVLERTWRSGFKSEDVAEELLAEIKRREHHG